MTDRSASKVWLVTGCSSGFGTLFISAITARGDKVIATARNVSSIIQYDNGVNIRVMQLDVNASQEHLNSKVREAQSFFHGIDVLVNNAGYVAPGVWEQVTHEEMLNQFATNVFGPMNLTRAVLPHFRSLGSGAVIFMSSIAAWRGTAAGGLYSSSKFALEGAVECLEQELLPFNIDTHLIVLGQFRTSVLDPSKIQATDSGSLTEYQAITANLQKRYAETHGRQRGDPAAAVERIIDVIKRQGPYHGHDVLPLRIFLGSDTVGVVQAKCEQVLADLSQFELVSTSTDYEDALPMPAYGRI